VDLHIEGAHVTARISLQASTSVQIGPLGGACGLTFSSIMTEMQWELQLLNMKSR